MSGVAHLLKSLGDFEPVSANVSIDSSAAVEELVQSVAAEESETPPLKKAKTIVEDSGWECLDVSKLVTHYGSFNDVPEHLKKCE